MIRMARVYEGAWRGAEGVDSPEEFGELVAGQLREAMSELLPYEDGMAIRERVCFVQYVPNYNTPLDWRDEQDPTNWAFHDAFDMTIDCSGLEDMDLSQLEESLYRHLWRYTHIRWLDPDD